MKKFYVVCTSFFDDGRVVSNIVDTVTASEKPEQGFKSTRRCDIYVDYFESAEEAREFVATSRCA